MVKGMGKMPEGKGTLRESVEYRGLRPVSGGAKVTDKQRPDTKALGSTDRERDKSGCFKEGKAVLRK